MIAVFHNKGGVGKSTLLFHTACALAEQGHKVLMMDLDPDIREENNIDKDLFG